MIDIQAMDKALIRLIEKRNEVHALDYSAPNYDDLEEELHDLEDDFLGEYGEYLEDGIAEVYEEFELDSDVLSPLAYVARSYQLMNDDKDNPQYNITSKDGLPIDVPGYEEKDTRLIVLPNPTRVFLLLKGKGKEVWRAGKEKAAS